MPPAGSAVPWSTTCGGRKDRTPGPVAFAPSSLTAASAAELANLPGVDPVVGDIRRPDCLAPLFAGLDGTVDVIHTAGVIHPPRVDDFTEVNERGTANVVQAASAAGVRRVVHVSSNSPFGTNPHRGDTFTNDEPFDPYLGYGRSKMRAELRVQDAVAAGLDAVIVRPPWFYGPFQPARQTTFFRLVRTGRFPVIGDGRQRRSMVHVDNLVQGVVRAELADAPAGFGVVDRRRPAVRGRRDRGDRRALPRRRGLRRQAQPRCACPPSPAGSPSASTALIQRTGRYVQQVHVLGEMDKTITCDISVARAELGYEPTIALEEGMRQSIRWCVEQGLEL